MPQRPQAVEHPTIMLTRSFLPLHRRWLRPCATATAQAYVREAELPNGLGTLFVAMTGGEEAMSVERPGNGGYRLLNYTTLDSARAEVWRALVSRIDALHFDPTAPPARSIARSNFMLRLAHGTDPSTPPLIERRYIDRCAIGSCVTYNLASG